MNHMRTAGLSKMNTKGIDDDYNGYVDDVYGWAFRDNDNNLLIGFKTHWHETFVAGIIAAQPAWSTRQTH